ncbi:hypothetical protein AJ79_00682 [Helicocarpus griseus UAMH5409]|uniref:Uncharacterized protein n=1 Tax=Helicocarpus griseus UAMH5409 TaxID=1447875 RepID=A0A2B7Y9X2_9EURO|nr:hypothetical protein AJ79_00682 [Helicocarpus griseus UAMH5409]
MHNFDLCREQLSTPEKKVIETSPSDSVVEFENIPPACMNLASALEGSCTTEEAHPTPCGSACLQYAGLTDEQIEYSLPAFLLLDA